jgi:hypothetical protein
VPLQEQESEQSKSQYHFKNPVIHNAGRNSPLDLLPQAQVEPVGLVFSCEEREHVQAPAARWLQEQRAPSTLFSVAAFSQVQCRAGCLPHEQVASLAQTHPPSRPQQVTGTAATGADIVMVWFGVGRLRKEVFEKSR